MVFQTALLDCRRGGWGQSAIGICALCYISASRSAKFGVVVFKTSLLESGGQSVIDHATLYTSPVNQQ